ncbi:MAG: 4-aminobutyrate--2-oxoglutarate transaminase [Limnochordales bacterium]|nr:MAG: 4-aminobutyrate--2-oxoglutarate transaminase [Bacillota bacterium]HLT59286.1 4-aminobutyrate--2-oxoglutarate transaminase [Limnochordales bacterium]
MDQQMTDRPRSAAILAEHARWVARAKTPHVGFAAAQGRGAILVDVDGREYIDFSGGVGSLNVGHCHPKVVAAIRDQVERFLHTDYAVVPYENYVEVCRRLCEAAPGNTPKKALLFNTGAEAVENAVKIARYATGRPAVIAFEGAFHGRTYMAMSLTSRVHPYKAGFGPFVPEVYRIPYPNPYRGITTDMVLESLARLFRAGVAATDVAAIVVEPIQGEGGYIVPPDDFLPRLREVADEHGIVLIVDEVQTGFGRTGRMFALEHVGVEPDLMTVGKSLGGGLPLSGVVGKASLMDEPVPGGLGGTFPGNPVACAAALAVFDILQEENLLARAEAIGRQMLARMRRWVETFPFVGDARGRGAMVALELVQDKESQRPAGELTRRVVRQAWEQGVIVLQAGLEGNVLRFPMPLVITDEQLQRGLDILEQVLQAMAAEG